MTTKQKQKSFLENLEAAKGIIVAACKATKISRGTYYNWYKSDPEFKNTCDEINEETIDAVESKLLNNINNGDTTAIIFYLKTKGRNRGYVEHQQVALSHSVSPEAAQEVSYLVEQFIKASNDAKNL